MDRQRRIEVFLQAAHRLAVSRLRAEPGRLGEVRALLHRWREQSGRTRSDVYWDEWEQLLELPIDDLESVICADDEHATVLRSVSPIGVLISQAERRELLREARRS
jgi:hypothetical protein